MTSTEKNKHWAQAREVGTLLGFQFLLLIHKIFGRFIFALFLWPALAYFVAFKAAPRKASLQYLRRVHLLTPELFSGKPNIRHVILHFFHFGSAVLDKLLAWSTNLSEDDFLVKDTRELEALMSDERGQLIIGSHFGNLEYCRGFVHRYKTKVINVLLYDQHAANYVKMMQKVNPNSRVNLYQVTDLDVPTILSLKNKVDAGEWLFIAGDRVPIGSTDRTLNVSFLGFEAPLPIGPYMLAKTLGCPVKLMFAYRQGKKIQFEVIPFADRVEIPRKNREGALLAYTQQYAAALEKQCRTAPYQWFNFYPFWSSTEEREK